MPHPALAKLIKLKLFGKSPGKAYLRLNKRIWNDLPGQVTGLSPIRIYGRFLHTLVCLSANRCQYFGTFFLRNRPQLDLIRRLSAQKNNDSVLRIAVMACSNGAEVYSILWAIRSAWPKLKIILNAVDISKEILEIGRRGVYSFNSDELVKQKIFERVSEEEMQELFDKEGEEFKIKSCIKEGIIWHLADARDPEIIDVLGCQDMVVANNFLCHMDPSDAEGCLRNLARLVRPGGYLFVSGIDLDIRTKVARDLSWKPVVDSIKEIHDGDPIVRGDWPFEWWGLEPFDKRRHDWNVRYASAFQLGERGELMEGGR